MSIPTLDKANASGPGADSVEEGSPQLLSRDGLESAAREALDSVFYRETSRGIVRFRPLNGRDLKDIMDWIAAGNTCFELALICFCLLDPAGKPMFRKSELVEDTFDNWDAGFIRELGTIIDETIGFSVKLNNLNSVSKTAKN